MTCVSGSLSVLSALHLGDVFGALAVVHRSFQSELTQARDALSAKRFGVARHRLSRLAERWTNDGEVLLLLGDSEVALGKPNHALACWARVPASSPFLASRAVRGAYRMVEDGQYSPAESLLLETLANPRLSARYELELALTWVYWYQGRFHDIRPLIQASWCRSPQPALVLKELWGVVLADGVRGGRRRRLRPRKSTRANEPTAKFTRPSRDMLQRHKVLERTQVFAGPLRLSRATSPSGPRTAARPSLPYDAVERGHHHLLRNDRQHREDVAKARPPDEDDHTALVTGGVIEEVLHCMAAGHPAGVRCPDVGPARRTPPTCSPHSSCSSSTSAPPRVHDHRSRAAVRLCDLGARQGRRYVSEASPPAQRFYNFLCIAYGGEPSPSRAWSTKGFLPKDQRQAGAALEYKHDPQSVRSAP